MAERKQALNERVSNIVYHFCSTNACLGICTDNAFVLSSILRGSADGDVNKSRYYLSLTRQRTGKIGFSQSRNVRITLDGDALNQRYKGGPVDYWGDSMGKRFYYRDAANHYGHIDTHQSRTENEDRIFSKKPMIPDADRYIRRIDILLSRDKNGEFKTFELGCVQRILRTSLRDMVFVYESQNDFEYQTENTINQNIIQSEIVPIYDVLDSQAYIENSTKNSLKDILNIITSYEYKRKDIPGVCAKLLKQYGLEKYIGIVNDVSNMRWNIDDMLANTQMLIDSLRQNNRGVYVKAMEMLDSYLDKKGVFDLRQLKAKKEQIAQNGYDKLRYGSSYVSLDWNKKVSVLCLLQTGIDSHDEYVASHAIAIPNPQNTSIWQLIPEERRYFVDDVLYSCTSHNSKSDESFKKYLLHFVRQEIPVSQFMDMLNKLQIPEEKKEEILGYRRFEYIELNAVNYDHARYVSDEDKKWVENALKTDNLNEAYLYHRGRNVDVQNPDPYHSEGRVHKWEGAGHETGSFGSGMYFTDAYPNDHRFSDETKAVIRKSEYDPRNYGERFIQVADGLYRVDTDFYKNLYILHSEGEGNVLEELMEKINAFVRNIYYANEDDPAWIKKRQRWWMVIQRNTKLLGLKLPWDYRGFCEFAKEYIANREIKQTPATIFMELNGFNGVDASLAGRYNTYHQGSVIYDLSKVEKHIVPAQGERDNFKLAHHDLFRNLTDDLLDNKPYPTSFKSGEYASKPDDPQEVISALKRYGMVLPHNCFFSLPDNLKSIYLKILYRNIKNGLISLDPTYGYYPSRKNDKGALQEYVRDIIKMGAVDFMNIDDDITDSILNKLAWGFEDRDNVIRFLNAYQGDITKFDDYNEIKQEYNL